MSRHAGIPLLSGPPPPHPGSSQSACRKCGKEFNILFHRQRKCMHCGYGYCSSCTDYQALMPRRGPSHGYDPAPVCAFCIEMLNVTALGRTQLRSIPLAKLRRYTNAYNIQIKNAIDKNDLVDAAMAARTPEGCLSPAFEDYYRKHSVPSLSAPGSSSSSANRNTSPRGSSNTNTNNGPRSNSSFPRPDLDPNRQQRPQGTPYSTYAPRSTTNTRPRTTSAPMNPSATRPTAQHHNIPRPTSSSGRQFTPRSGSPNHHSTSSLPPPPMSTLVTLPRSSISTLSAGTLKQILWESRVRIPPGVVEKDDLVERVWALIEEERMKDNEGIDDISPEEEWEHAEAPVREEEVILDPEVEAHDPEQGNDHHTSTAEDQVETGHDSNSGLPHSRPTTPQSSASPKSKPRPHPKPMSAERSGLCVICQDEEANIAIVDCGHLAMCRACSDLVLASSRECPLCRTRIVTEARLLRIFKT